MRSVAEGNEKEEQPKEGKSKVHDEVEGVGEGVFHGRVSEYWFTIASRLFRPA